MEPQKCKELAKKLIPCIFCAFPDDKYEAGTYGKWDFYSGNAIFIYR